MLTTAQDIFRNETGSNSRIEKGSLQFAILYSKINTLIQFFRDNKEPYFILLNHTIKSQNNPYINR